MTERASERATEREADEKMRADEAYKRNLAEFTASLPATGVRFMCFQWPNFAEPAANAVLGSWDIGGVPCLVAPGDQEGYCSVYRETTLTRMIFSAPAVAQLPFAGYRDAMHALATHGDRVTFGFIRALGDRIVIKTSKSHYSEIADFKFDRVNQGECNFRAPASDSAEAESRERFAGAVRDKFSELSLGETYRRDALVPDMVYALYRVVAGTYRIGRNGRKKYQQQRQRGAAPDYKGSGFISPEFIRFLSGTIFQPIASLRPDIVSVQVFFDELNELGRDTNRTILILYDFEEGERNVFYIHTLTAFAAAYAAEHPAAATAYEKTCLQQFLAAVAHPATGLAASVAPL